MHVSPVWLRDWRRGPVGVTTEAGVCEGWEEGKKGVGEEKGETKEEGEEEKDKGGRWGKGRPSFRVGLLSSKWPHCPTSPSCAAPSFGPLPEEAPSSDGRGMDVLPEDRLFSSEQDSSSLILRLLTYKMQWSNRHLPGFVELETVHVLESQNMVPGPSAAAAAFKNVLEMQIIGLISDLLYQILWGWSVVICMLTNPLGDSHSSFRTAGGHL